MRKMLLTYPVRNLLVVAALAGGLIWMADAQERPTTQPIVSGADERPLTNYCVDVPEKGATLDVVPEGASGFIIRDIIVAGAGELTILAFEQDGRHLAVFPARNGCLSLASGIVVSRGNPLSIKVVCSDPMYTDAKHVAYVTLCGGALR